MFFSVIVPISWGINGPDKCEPGDLVTFELTAEDSNGKKFDVQGNISGVLLINDKSRGLCEEKGRVRKKGVGEFEIDFIPRLIGKHQLSLQNGHMPLFKNTQIVLNVLKQVPEETLNYEFELTGKGLLIGRVNEELNFTLTVTQNSKPCDLNSSKFSVRVFGNGKTSIAETIRTGVGEYHVTFHSATPGIFSASVIYEDNKVLKQRMDIYEVASPFHSRVCDLQQKVPVGKPQTINLQSLDTHGNPIGVGGDVWEIEIKQLTPNETSGTLPLKLIDEGNGNYRVDYTLLLPGTYRLTAKVNDKEIRRSPFKLTATQ